MKGDTHWKKDTKANHDSKQQNRTINFFRCILGLLKDKVCVLVTHQLQYLKDGTSILCLKEVSTIVILHPTLVLNSVVPIYTCTSELRKAL